MGDDEGSDDGAADDATNDGAATGDPAGDDVTVREATREDLFPALNVLDAAMLDTEHVEGSLAAGDVLVAAEGDRILGALVLADERTSSSSRDSERLCNVGSRIDSIAVRRARRGQGIGSALVTAAAARTDLIAEFDGRNRPFYRSLGFEIERIGPDRFRGRLPANP